MSIQRSYKVEGMKCQNCIQGATRAVAALPGYVASEFSLEAHTLVLSGDVDPDAVCQALTEHGYPTTQTDT